jgi:hypothetical protein
MSKYKLSNDLYVSLVTFFEEMNELEKEYGDKLGIVYTRDAVTEVFIENENYRSLFYIEFDGKLTIPDDEDLVYEFLNKINEKAVSEMFADMMHSEKIDVVVDESGEVIYKVKTSENLSEREERDIIERLVIEWRDSKGS